MIRPQKYQARLSEKYYLTENKRFLYLKFEMIEPKKLEFEAGQYVSLKINEQGERRSYSIVSTPDNDHGFHLLTEVVEGGKGSKYLENLVLGAEVEALAPMGQFRVKGGSDKLLFIATGTGIVPIWSMINDLLLNKQENRQIRLHWGMRGEEDLFFIDDLERLAEAHSNFVYDLVLSKPSEEWELCSGHVQDCLARDFEKGLLGWDAYVCGRPETVVSIREKLVELGMNEQLIYHEKFN